MKELFFSFIFLKLINLSISLVPIWDIKNSSIELDKSKTITLHTKDSGPKISLIKKFEENETSLYDQNYINVQDKGSKKTNWEDIESSYSLDNWGYIICPKGRNFLNIFYSESNTFDEIKPTNFENENKVADNDQWELLCYRIGDKDFMFQGFLEQEKIKNMYGYKYSNKDNNWKSLPLSDSSSFLDFKLTYKSNSQGSTKEYDMSALYLKNSEIYSNLVKLTIDYEDELFYNPTSEFYLDEKLDFTYGYFNHTTKKFYWISTSSANNYSSGYSTEGITKDDIKVTKNNISPLKFLQNVTINKIEMIRNTRFAYYEVISLEDNNKYFGIIDIVINQVIFNTNEKLLIFKPIRNTSMLAITEDKKIYQICLNKWNNECVESCPDDQILILDSEKGNHCEDKDTPQNCKDFLLIPEQICVSTCNTSIYTIISEEENGLQKCGLCKDFYNDKQFKIFNEPDCLEIKPNGTFYLSEEFKILKRCDENCSDCDSYEKCNKCKIGFKKDDSGHCELIPCHSDCEFCDENENCISCKNDLLLQENNCVENCSQGYYKQENKQQKACLKCHKNCKICSNGPLGENENCNSCKNDLLLQENNCVENCSQGYYKHENKQQKACLKCHKNCKTCSNGPLDENENCEQCESNFYLIDDDKFPKNCVETCPEGLSVSDNYCKVINESKKDPDYMLWIFIILFAILLILISLCICKRHFSKNKKDVEIINDINTELQENNRIIE